MATGASRASPTGSLPLPPRRRRGPAESSWRAPQAPVHGTPTVGAAVCEGGVRAASPGSLGPLPLERQVGADRLSRLLRGLRFLGTSIRGRESRAVVVFGGTPGTTVWSVFRAAGGGAGASPGALTPPAQKLSTGALGERLRALWELGCVAEAPLLTGWWRSGKGVGADSQERRWCWPWRVTPPSRKVQLSQPRSMYLKRPPWQLGYFLLFFCDPPN